MGDVRNKIKELISNEGDLYINTATDLHKIFDTEDWNDRKWILEITYCFGDYCHTLSTEQNEELDNYQNNTHSFFNNSYYSSRQYEQRLSKEITISNNDDRTKQIYHYRLTKLFKKYDKPREHILDHLNKNEGKEHKVYVYLCK